MASPDSGMSTGDQAEKDIKGAINMGRQAAQTAKTVSAAAAKAASGNVVGAAATVLKDPQTLKTILIFILIPIFFFMAICVLFLYALPTAVFESVESTFSSATMSFKDAYNNARYSGSGTLSNTLRGLASGVWAFLENLFTDDDDVSTSSYNPTNSELAVVYDEEAETSTLEAKIQACQEKLKTRESQVLSAIRKKKGSSSATSAGTLYGSIRSAIRRNPDFSRYSLTNGHIYVSLNLSYESPSEETATEIIGLYTVQTGASLDDVKIYTLLRWLGWQKNKVAALNDDINFNIFSESSTYKVTCTIEEWTGTFLPQYLLEQKNQDIENDPDNENEIEDEYEDYQAALADLAIYVDSPTIDEMLDSVSIVAVRDPETNAILYYKAYATVSITVKVREFDELAEIAGLWDGKLKLTA